MNNRVLRIFRRYVQRHAHMDKKGFPLIDSRGCPFGHIDRISIRENRLWVEGWALSNLVGIANGEHKIECVPSLSREDVVSKVSEARDKNPGFILDIPLSQNYTVFWTQLDKFRYVQPLPPITTSELKEMQRAQIIPFLYNAILAFPAAIHWFLKRDMASVARIKALLKLDYSPRSAQLNNFLFYDDVNIQGNQPVELQKTAITIIMPVYNAFHLLPDVVARILKHTDLPWHLIIVEDYSSDSRVRPWLKKWRDNLPSEYLNKISLIENDKNLGFVKSVNAALSLAIPQKNHVVLLNSDAFVPERWASRLIRPIIDYENIATVTPMSNDAEIFSVPNICKTTTLNPGEGDEIDKVAQKFFPGADVAEVPTGVGFCMAININYLRRFPKFDPIFERGYGEEVDWCQRVRLKGGRHLGIGGLFVEHRGGTSFGSKNKKKLIENNNEIISSRYPRYDSDVQEFIIHDPLNTPRLALAFAWIAASQKVAVKIYVAHSLGGGAENYLQDCIKNNIIGGQNTIVLRLGGTSRWKIEIHTSSDIIRGETNCTDFVGRLLGILHQKRIIYSCAVGDRDPINIPSILIKFANQENDKIEVLMHDYFPLSPSYTLLEKDGVYRGVPMPETQTDSIHSVVRADGTKADLEDWRASWGQLLKAAHVITTFSDNSRQLVVAAYPAHRNKVVIVPHQISVGDIQISRNEITSKVPVIGILGNIGYQKGAGVLRSMSKFLSDSGKARMVVLGNVDPTYTMTDAVHIHGDYKTSDIPGLVTRYQISRWLIPSIWPETFSYTTHEALATGLPVFSFDLGAQGDAVQAAARKLGYGGTISLHEGHFCIESMLTYILETEGLLSNPPSNFEKSKLFAHQL